MSKLHRTRRTYTGSAASPLALATLLGCVFCGVVSSLVGCGQARPAVTDSETASRLLTQSLNAWKEGRSVQDMRQLNPPIYVADDLWLQGFQLAAYSLEGPGEPSGTNVRFHVKLKGVSASGNAKEKSTSVERRVKYLVTSTPAQTIAREDR